MWCQQSLPSECNSSGVLGEGCALVELPWKMKWGVPAAALGTNLSSDVSHKINSYKLAHTAGDLHDRMCLLHRIFTVCVNA